MTSENKYPIIGVGGILIENGKILLVKRATEPSKGLWAIPGGKLKWGENIEDAVKREIFEETGLEVEVLGLEDVYELIVREGENIKYHYVILDYRIKRISGRLKASTDVLDAKFFSKEELINVETSETTKKLLKKLIDKYEIY
ncbi:MAG: NUDIX hydrolase [Candidatus Methanomethylicia archaeon]|nr:NUDIX hydrolase [Candidatus Methanomethylicia archaeon]